MMRTFIPAALCLFLITTVYAADTRKPVLREWSDNTGTFRVRATFVDFDSKSKTVRLKLSSGQTVDLPMRRLSTADQNYVSARSAPPAGKPQRPRIRNIAGIDWIESREDASRAALGQKSVNDDRPIMCFRALGDLSGFM